MPTLPNINYSLEILFVVRKTLLHFPHVNSHFPMKWPKICVENNAVSTSQRVPLVHKKSCNTRVSIQYLNTILSASVVYTSDPQDTMTPQKPIPCATYCCISINSGISGTPINYTNVIGSTSVFQKCLSNILYWPNPTMLTSITLNLCWLLLIFSLDFSSDFLSDFSLDFSGLPELSLGEKIKQQIALSDELCGSWLILVKQHRHYLYTAVNFSLYNCSIISFCPEPFLPPDSNLYLLQHYEVFEEMM